MKKIKTIISLIVAFTTLGVFADDSAPFFLNTVKGTRIAKKTELISYSTEWDKGSSVRVTADGATLKEAVAPASGDVAWDGAKASLGLHTLTHVSGGKTLTAQFTVLGDDVVMHSGVLKSSEIWDTNKVHLVTGAITVPSGISLTINSGAVVKFMPGMSMAVIGDGSCTAKGAIFTHVNDDTIGGDTLMDEDSTVPKMGEYTITGNVIDNDATEYRYSPPQTLTSNISSDTRLRGYRTYILSNSVTVARGAKLTLRPGTILKFNSGCSLTVNGTLNAIGTRAQPIVFTSIKDDEHGGDTNGDGDKTYPYYNDWKYIVVAGKATFDYAVMMYGGGASNSSESGMLIGQSGGMISLNGCTLAHALYDGIFSRAAVSGENTIIYDCDRGINTCGGSGVFKNCVIDSCRWGVMAEGGSGTYYNCIITRFFGSDAWPTGWGVAYWSGSLKTYNCCVWSTLNGASNYRSSPTKVNNISIDPLFVDPDNGDFRISAGSPCVDAGNGDFAPETDYYGQPRMDVKKIKNTGIVNAEGVCPDIGIYEVPGTAAVPVADLAVMSVSVPEEAVSGESITVTYVVTNRGGIAASGSVRDQVVFTSGGNEVAADDVIVPYSIHAFDVAEKSVQVKVPPLSKGDWRVGVKVNQYRDVYEVNLANNGSYADSLLSVTMSSLEVGSASVGIYAGETVGFELSNLSLDGGYVRVVGDSSVIGAACGNGLIPQVGAGLSPIILADGSQLVAVPPRKEGEIAYLVIGNSGMMSEGVTVEVAQKELKLYEVSPSTAVNSGEATFVLTGCGMDEGTSVTIGGMSAKSIFVLGDMQIAATFDMSGVSAGTHSMEVRDGDGNSAILESAVNVQAPKIGPKLKAWLETPTVVRDGRVFAAYVCYKNEGDEPMTMPCFKVARTDSTTRMGLEASETMSDTELFIGGISPTYPAGVLKPGDSGRVVFYFQPFGTYGFNLTSVKDTDDTTRFPAFGGVKAYLKAMSDAATRLNRRGKTSYNIHNFVDQALWEKNGIAHAAVSGRLLDSKSRLPIVGVSISLVDGSSANMLPSSSAVTDSDGYFQLTSLSDGDYRFVVENSHELVDVSTNVLKVSGQVDVNGIDVYVVSCGKISGVVMGKDGMPVGYGTVGVRNSGGDVVRSVLCDGFGGYSIGSLPYGVYEVQALGGDGYIADRVTNVIISSENRSENVVFDLDLGGMITGTVRFGTGVGSGGKVQAVLSNGDSYSATCSTNGVYSFVGLPEGLYAVRYYSEDAISADVRVEVKAGKTEEVDLSADKRPLFFPVQSVGYGSLNTKFLFSDYVRATNATSYAWDFNGDGVTDSTAIHPSWTFNEKGTHTVSVRIREKDGETESTYVDCVEVRESIPTRFKENVLVIGGSNGGTLRVVEVMDDKLVLSGVGDIALAKGAVIVCDDGEVAFARKVVSVSGSSSLWTVKTENAELTDVYFSFAAAGIVAVEENSATPVSLMSTRTQKASASKSSDSNFKVFHDSNMTLEPIFNLQSPVVDYAFQIIDGNVNMHFNYCLSFNQGMRIAFDGESGVEYSDEISFDSLNSKVLKLSWGFMVYPDLSAGLSVSGALKGKGHITAYDMVNLRYGFKVRDNVTTWLPPYEKTPHFYGGIDELESGSLQASLFFKPGIKFSWMKTLLSAGIYGEVSNNLTIDSGSEGNPPKADMTYSIKVIGEANLVDIDWGDNIKLFEHIDFKLHLVEPYEMSLFSRETLSMTGPRPDFNWTADKSTAPATISFRNKTKGTEVNWFGRMQTHEPTAWIWNINGAKYTEKNPVVTFTEEGRYPVSLRAKGYLISGRNVKKATVKVGKPEDIPDDGENELRGGGGGASVRSWDPNEVSGPAGKGARRYVEPGEWMTYTIFFENKEGFDIADAQEVKVSNPLSEWLDWSTFEMGEIAFNNQIDPGLNGRSSGTSEVKMNGTNKYVRTTVSLDRQTGVVQWNMRVYDPNGILGWPNDGSGFLPSNDETHRGEGHLTYRIKLRDDAPHGVVVTNSASIVFDYNEPIETDPAWWNTVGVPGAGFGKSEISVEEGENITFTVSGGADDKASSVKLYLTYNTAAAADVDLKNGTVDSSTSGSPVPNAQAARSTNLKFPLTLTWAAGEIGEKTITIPVLADKSIEDSELLTLQLCDPVGMELGEARLCTVTITDPGYAELEAKILAGTATKAEQTAWDKLQKAKAPYIRGVADPANAGKVTGSGLCALGKKVTLKAAANKGYVFTGWLKSQIALDGDRLVTNAVEYIATTPSLVIDRTAKPTKDTATSTTLTDVNDNATFYATFITADEDKAAVGLTLNGGEVPQAEGSVPSLTTNIMCGVALNWPLASSALSQTTVKVAGLPAGLKFTAKDIMKKGSKTEVEIPANTIYGAPTAASKIDKKTGLPVPSAVKVTVTTAGKSSVTYLMNITVDALPAWAVGNFEGFVRYDENDGGFATMSITAAGKVSGKIAYGGTNWTFKVDSYDITSETVGSTNFIVETVAVSGKTTRNLWMTITDIGRDYLPDSAVAFVDGIFGDMLTEMHRLPWKDKGDADAAALIASYAGAYSCSVPYGDDSGDVTFVLDEKGAVKGTVVLPDGDKTRKATFSSNALTGDNSLSVVIALPPDAKKGYPAVFKVVNLVNHSGEGADDLAFRDPGVVAAVAELTAESGATGTVSVNPKYGQVVPGKDVTLTAKAAKGSVFHRWEITGVDTEGLDLSSATLKFKMTDAGDVFATAVFATTQEDAASLALDLADAITETDGAFLLDLGARVSSLSLAKLTVVGLPAGLKYDAKTMTISGKATKPGLYTVKVTATNASATGKNAVVGQFTIEVPNFTAANSYFVDNLYNDVGEKYTLSVGISNIDDFLPSLRMNSPTAKLAVSGLPAGLKYDAANGKITGVATKAGTYTVTLTVTDGKAKYVSTITIEVEALPDWVVGTFNGYIDGSESYAGDWVDWVTITITSSGKVSYKDITEDGSIYIVNPKDITFKQNESGDYIIETDQRGIDWYDKKELRLGFVIIDGVTVGVIEGESNGADIEDGGAWTEPSIGEFYACQNVWKIAQGTRMAPGFIKNTTTSVSMSLMRDDVWDSYYGGYLTLKYGANGAVTTAYSETVGGKATATGSAQLVPYEVDGDTVRAWLYTALKPKGREPFGVLLFLSIDTSNGNVYGDDVTVDDYLLEVEE